ncbi:MAG TPA: hypothetical protein VM716_16505 [Gemmatimonadales bacterium]|nr:hypothetical protein [Gemmatimonadales bacterium]
MRRGRLFAIGATLVAVACVEESVAPGRCPGFCPSGQIVVVDTVLRANISRDSAFRGYVTAFHATYMLAADLPGFVDSRPIFRVPGLGPRLSISTGDTSTGPILGADSARLQVVVVRRDTAAHNLTLRLYRLPITIDSTTTFGDLAGSFTDSLVRTINVDTLLARAGHKDTVTGDSVFVDTTTHILTFSLKLAPAAARYIAADSGKVAYGVRVSADSLASIALSRGVALQWFLQLDSLGVTVRRKASAVGANFTNFVFDPPAPPLDSTLVVGGVPSARSILRVTWPRVIRDSSQVIRGTLVLVSAAPVGGAPPDSFVLEARTVLSDFGAKSPLDARFADTAVIHRGRRDTVAIEVTNILQAWALDTTAPTTFLLRSQTEAQSFAEARFYPSLTAAFRPTLQVTFVRRFQFGRRQ